MLLTLFFSCIFCFCAITSHYSDDQENTHVSKRDVCKGAVTSAAPNAGSGMEKGGVRSHDGQGSLCPPEGARCTRHKACSIPKMSSQGTWQEVGVQERVGAPGPAWSLAA